MDDIGVKSWQGQEVFNFSYGPEWLWGLPNFLFLGYQGSFPEVKRPGHEVDHSPQFSAEVKNCGDVLLLPLICHNAMDRNNSVY
jgi:hypothetical protein